MEVKEAIKKVRENWLRKVRINELLAEEGSEPIYDSEYLAGMMTVILQIENYMGLDLDENDCEEI